MSHICCNEHYADIFVIYVWNCILGSTSAFKVKIYHYLPLKPTYKSKLSILKGVGNLGLLVMEYIVYRIEYVIVPSCSSHYSHYLCCRVKHFLVQTKAELHDALVKSKEEQIDCVVEVDSSIDSNANFHRFLS